MNKRLIILGIAVLLICVGLSGCTDSSTESDWQSNWEKQREKEDQMKEDFETAMESVAGDFVDESHGHNFDTSQTERDCILNYTQNQFEQHSSLIYDNDDFCESNDTFAYQWENCREYVIEGLRYLVHKDFANAHRSLWWADNEILMTDYKGNYWSKQFGFENGICDILLDMGYELQL